MFDLLLRCHRQDEVRNTAPQSTVLVEVHPVKRYRMAFGEELLLQMVVHHLFHGSQTSLSGDLLLLPQQHCEDHKSLLVGGVLVVAVAIKNERGARGQLLEAVNDGHGLVALEGSLQLAVDVQLDLVAVLAGLAGPVDVEDGGVEGRREGGGQPLSQAAQCPLASAARGQDQTDRLSGLGRLEVPQQVDLAPAPDLRALMGELSLYLFQLPEEDVFWPHFIFVRWRLGLEEMLPQDGNP